MNLGTNTRYHSQNADLRELLAAAAAGNRPAWNNIVELFTPLVSSVVRRYRLTDSDGDDVRQELWLKLVRHLDDLREPRALPGWILTTTRNEALRVLRAQRRIDLVDPLIESQLGQVHSIALDEGLLQQERCQAMRTALGTLKVEHQQLILVAFADPDISYRQIGRWLGMPIGSIGPTRARCLEKLRNTAAVQALAS